MKPALADEICSRKFCASVCCSCIRRRRSSNIVLNSRPSVTYESCSWLWNASSSVLIPALIRPAAADKSFNPDPTFSLTSSRNVRISSKTLFRSSLDPAVCALTSASDCWNASAFSCKKAWDVCSSSSSSETKDCMRPERLAKRSSCWLRKASILSSTERVVPETRVRDSAHLDLFVDCRSDLLLSFECRRSMWSVVVPSVPSRSWPTPASFASVAS